MSHRRLPTLNDVSLREAAFTYAEMGWPVLPLRERQKQPATRHGNMDASTDPDQIRHWWRLWPNANIGLRTGIAFDALDLDGEAGVDALLRLKPGYVHNGPISATGSGYHMLFKVSGSKNHARLLGEPIDFRGKGGYIVVAPSVHPLGHKYEWVHEESRLPAVPPWLAAHLFSPRLVRTTDPNDPTLKEALEKAGTLLDVFASMGCEIHPGPGDFLGVLSCPFPPHHPFDHTPSLYIYPNNTFTCFGCGAWGDALNVKRWIKTGKLRDI